ncbi:MAG: hypothetical protein WCT24_03215 [Patescibacteria group bacterium]
MSCQTCACGSDNVTKLENGNCQCQDCMAEYECQCGDEAVAEEAPEVVGEEAPTV